MSGYEPLQREGSDEDHSVASSVGAPPFALHEEHDDLHLTVVELSDEKKLKLSESSVPGLAASHAMSSVTTEGQPSMMQSSLSQNAPSPASRHHHSQHFDDGMETYVFSTSDSVLGDSQPSMFGSSHLPGSGTLWTHDSTTTTPGPHGSGSLNFSQLMRQADADHHQHEHNAQSSTVIVQARMPTLKEDQQVLVDSGQTTTDCSSNLSGIQHHAPTNQYAEGNWLSSLFQSSPQQHLHAVPLMTLSPSYLGTSEGPTNRDRDVQGTRLGENTFQVSMQIDPPSTVRDVLDVLGNPDLLRLWCDPIRDLVVTKSSESAKGSGDVNREYEGEWVEATTSDLVSPSKHSSCLYSLGQLMYSSLGFPSYGKITLFVERLRGQVGLTIGPFSGGIMASHTIKVQDDGPVVSVVDTVRLSRDEESYIWCCGLCEPIKKCFTPGIDGHIEQTMSSFLRLRILIEHGGDTGSFAAASPGIGYDDEEEGVSTVPLLS